MALRGAAGAVAPDAPTAPVRVMLVDDSGVSRALMTRWIEESGTGIVAAVAGDGRAAVDMLRRVPIDVVVLDIEMPELDGIAALPHLLAARPGVRILMASTFSERGARVTLEALRLGAADAIAKPRAGWAARGGLDFRQELIAKIVALGTGGSIVAMPRLRPVAARPSIHARAAPSRLPARCVVIGASTGGPNALFGIIGALPRDLSAPILVAQHMPSMFTAILAEHLGRHAGLPAHEGRDGMPVRPGHVYIAPGGFHMSVRSTSSGIEIAVDDGAPENFCRPSVNRLMRSAAEVYGAQALGVMLTGMGSDGLDGARALVAAGGTLIAQDQASSVVWGMPGTVVRAGLAAEILGVDAIAPEIVRLTGAA